MPPTKSLGRRIWRFSKWLVGGLTLALLLLLALLHTGWGRAVAKDLIVQNASDALPGTLKIGGLEGSLFGEPRLEELSLHSADNQEVLRIASIDLGLGITDLLGSALTIDKLAISGLHLNLVQAEDGTLNLMESLVDPNAPEGEDPWPLHLSGLSIEKSSLDFTDAAGKATHIRNLSLADLQVKSVEGTTSIGLTDLRFDLPMCADQQVSVSGRLEISESGTKGKDLRIRVGSESEIVVTELSLAADLSTVEAELSATLAPALLRCLQPEQQWLAPISLTGQANKAESDKEIGFALALTDNSLALREGRISPDGSQLGAKLTLQKFQPGEFVSLGNAVEASGNFHLDVQSTDNGGLQVDVSGDADAKVDEFVFALSKLSLINRGKEAKLSVVVSGYQGGIALGTTVDWGADPIVLRDGALKAEIPNLSALPFAVPVAGGIALADTTFSGPIDSLQVKGLLAGQSLRHQESRLRTLALHFDFNDLPTSYAGNLQLDAKGVAQGKEYIGRVEGSVDSDPAGKVFQLKLKGGQPKRLSAFLDAELIAKPNRNEITFRALRLRHRKLQASLRRRPTKPARLTLRSGGGMRVEDMLLSLAGGSLAISGSLESELRGTLRGVKLTPLLALVPDFKMPIAATIGGEIVAKSGKQGLATRVSLKTDSLTLSPTSEALRLSLSATMEAKRVATTVELQSESKGEVRLSASGHLPSGPMNRSPARHLRAAQVEFVGFDLALLRPLHPEFSSVGGLVQGKLSIGAGVNAVEGQLEATELSHESFRSKRSLKFALDANRNKAKVLLGLRDSSIGSAQLDLALRPPGPLHSPWLWPRSLDGVLRDTELSIEPLDLVALKRAFPSIDPEGLLRGGTLGGNLKLSDQGKRLDILLSADKVRGADLPAMSATLDSTILRGSTRIAWQANVDASNRADGEATLNVGLGLLRKHATAEHLLEKLRSASIDAKVSAKTNSPSLWSKMAGSKNRLPVEGQAQLRATLQGTLVAPSGSVNLDIADAKVDGIKLQQVNLVATLKKHLAEAEVSVAQSRHRRATASILFDTKAKKMRRGAIDAQDIDLRLLRALDKSGEGTLSTVAGVANGKLEVTGHWDAPEPAGALRVRDGAIDLGGTIMPVVGLSLEIKARESRLTLDGKGKSGNGRINISGQSKVTSKGLEDISLRLRTSKVPVVIASLVCSLDLDSRSQIVLRPGLVDIKTKVDNALVRIPVRSFTAGTRSLHSLDGMSDLVYVSPVVEDQDLTLDQSGTLIRLRIVARDTVTVRAKVMQATLGLDLDTTFIDDKVVVNGGAKIASGHIDLFARRYRIEKASANFRGRVPVNPSFDFRLRHDFDQLALSILGRGDLDDQTIDFVGDPADYDQTTLLAIVLGQAPAQNEEQIGLRDNALSALSTYAANKVQELLAPILPFDLDVLRVENTDNDGYLYVGGDWITDDWFVAYNHRTLADELENTNEAESKYRLSKSWSLEGIAGTREGGVDILWTRRWGK